MAWRKALHEESRNKKPTPWPTMVVEDVDSATAQTGLDRGASASTTTGACSSYGTMEVDEHMSNTSPSNLEHDKSTEFESSVDRE